MKTITLTRVTLSILILFMAARLLVSCGKSNSNPTPPASSGKTAIFTVTANGVNTNDVATFNVNGTALNGSKSIWKINGVVQNDQTIINLSTNDFMGATKTYVIESITPLVSTIPATVTYSANGNTFTADFKSEINSVVKENDQNITVTPNATYDHSFTY